MKAPSAFFLFCASLVIVGIILLVKFTSEQANTGYVLLSSVVIAVGVLLFFYALGKKPPRVFVKIQELADAQLISKSTIE